ncbi:MAG: FtsW/RodA/SpoVE family cell cycle protein [Desulfitobacteriaceae bacterium]|nr:FtsW/RodA/SpoVE family cell cycle protein [Desulfitobacteriaceae bacterium]
MENYRRPINIVALINLMAFGLLYFYQQPYDYRIVIVGVLITGIVYLTNILMIKLKYEDEILFLIVSMLASVGLIILYRLDPVLGYKQLAWFVLGNVLFFCGAYIYRKLTIWDQLIYVYPVLSLILFCLTLLFGTKIKGATNWIMIGSIGFQPSEIIKLLFIFFIAAYYRHPDKLTINNFPWYRRKIKLDSKYVFMFLVYLHIGFLAAQRELGTGLLFLLIYLIMLYVFDSNFKFFLANMGMVLLGGLAGFAFVHHVQVRFMAWMNPWADVAGKGYQITQSLFAIGAGGFFGTGIGLGQPEYIPEVTTDFIFSAICEELGVFGGVAVVLLYFILVYRGIKITLNIKDCFHKAVALGISVMLGFQSFIIIGGVIKLIPLTGITLPFISYGGSSLTTSFIALGILQATSFKAVGEEVTDAAEIQQENN